MNKRGQTIIYGLMLGLVIILLGLYLAPAVRDFTQGARNTTTSESLGLNCSNDSISNYDKATCLTTDLTLPYFIGAIIFIGGAILVSKIVFTD